MYGVSPNYGVIPGDGTKKIGLQLNKSVIFITIAILLGKNIFLICFYSLLDK